MKRLVNGAWHYMGSGSAVFAVIGFGFLLRVVALVKLAYLPLASDALAYHTMALRLLHGESFPPYWPPGLPYFLASVYRLFGATQLVGRASMLLFFLLFSFAIYLLVRKLCSTRAANLAVLIFAIYPTYIHHSVETLTQLPIATYLVGAAYLVVLVKEKKHWGYSVILGAILGLLFLTRANSLLLIALIPLYILTRTKHIGLALLPVFVSLVIVFGWILKAHEMTGRWILVNEANSMNLFFGNNPYTPLYKTWWFGSHEDDASNVPSAYTAMLTAIKSEPPDVRDRLYLKVALGHIVHRPDLFVVRTANRIRSYFAFDTYTGSFLISKYSINKMLGLVVILLDALFYCAIMAAAILQMFSLSSKSPRLGSAVLLLLMGGCYAIPYWLSFSHPTYHFPVVALFGVLAACFAGNVAASRKTGSPWPWTASAKRKYSLLLVGIVFSYIQIEWIWMMRSRI